MRDGRGKREEGRTDCDGMRVGGRNWCTFEPLHVRQLRRRVERISRGRTSSVSIRISASALLIPSMMSAHSSIVLVKPGKL